MNTTTDISTFKFKVKLKGNHPKQILGPANISSDGETRYDSVEP